MPEQATQPWDRNRTLLFMVMGLCLLDALLYLLGGYGYHVILAALFAVAGVGVRKGRRWAARLAITVAVVATLLELLQAVSGKYMLAGCILRIVLHVVLIAFLIGIWQNLEVTPRDGAIEQRGVI